MSKVLATKCSSEKTEFSNLNVDDTSLVYILGYTSDREVFFDGEGGSGGKGSMILVKKDLVNSIKLGLGKEMSIGLRRFFKNIDPGMKLSPPSDEKHIQTRVNRDEIDKWINDKSKEQEKR